jgi:hypothetical protein
LNRRCSEPSSSTAKSPSINLLYLSEDRDSSYYQDYDIGINYQPGKANIVADALSHKKYCNTTFARRMRPELHQEIRYLNLATVNETAMAVEVEPTLKAEIRKA